MENEKTLTLEQFIDLATKRWKVAISEIREVEYDTVSICYEAACFPDDFYEEIVSMIVQYSDNVNEIRVSANTLASVIGATYQERLGEHDDYDDSLAAFAATYEKGQYDTAVKNLEQAYIRMSPSPRSFITEQVNDYVSRRIYYLSHRRVEDKDENH